MNIRDSPAVFELHNDTRITVQRPKPPSRHQKGREKNPHRSEPDPLLREALPVDGEHMNHLAAELYHYSSTPLNTSETKTACASERARARGRPGEEKLTTTTPLGLPDRRPNTVSLQILASREIAAASAARVTSRRKSG